jgi:Glycogen debranching enzyme
MIDAFAAAGRHIDLAGAPFTLPRSRLLVFKADQAPVTELTVRVAEYERRLDECVVVDRLRVRGADGAVLPVSQVRPDRIEFGGGVASLTFAGPTALSIGADEGRAISVDLEISAVIDQDGLGWTPGLPSAARAGVVADGTVRVDVPGLLRVDLPAGSGGMTIATGDLATDTATPSHSEHLHATHEIWAVWFDRCPIVRRGLQEMTAFCWWVLGANIVELPGQAGARSVVPSKIGYVGLWQWDAYFIAVGVRHGDPELAREQLDLALGHPTADGQLPDVVHDEGVLASSDDLPPGDLETLRKHGSAVADPDASVALTKPPLTAWAIGKVLEKLPDPEWARQAYEVAARSQDWWFAFSDHDADGMPEYGHPYSSGLDDSPIFDGPLPVASPDLAAYLVLQDVELSRYFDGSGDAVRARRHADRASATQSLLEAMWDDQAGYFRASADGHPLDAYTAVSLLPMLPGRLPEPILDRLLAALDDPDEFATPFAVPTVAVRDPAFSTERMWRGPVWININALLVDALRRSGQPERARSLAERTVALVIHGGGPHEYFNPTTGLKARTATTAFGWSAALFVDLAVQLSD